MTYELDDINKNKLLFLNSIYFKKFTKNNCIESKFASQSIK